MVAQRPPLVRTAGTDRTKKELSRDLAYLVRLWKVIVRRIKKLPAPLRQYIGNLADKDRILVGLDLKPKKK